MAAECKINHGVTDAISSIKFSPVDPGLLAISSWDKVLFLIQSVTCLDIVANTQIKKFYHQQAVLDISYSPDGAIVYSGGLDRQLVSNSLGRGDQSVIGSHEDAIRSIVTDQPHGRVVSGSWDKSVSFWDPRNNQQNATDHLELPGKVFTMDLACNMLVVGMAGRHVHIFDVRKLAKALLEKESPLKFQIRKIACIPSGEGYATSSIDGRVSVEHFDPADAAKQFAFKCHRKKADGAEYIYPVNALCYHPMYFS